MGTVLFPFFFDGQSNVHVAVLIKLKKHFFALCVCVCGVCVWCWLSVRACVKAKSGGRSLAAG